MLATNQVAKQVSQALSYHMHRPDRMSTWQNNISMCAGLHRRTMFLPSPPGRFPVGATTFKLAVPKCPFSSAKVRSASSELKDALVLEEVAFTAFYPADVQVPLKSTPRGLDWLLRFVCLCTPWFNSSYLLHVLSPLRASLQGYSNYSGDSPSLKPHIQSY